MQVNPTYPGVYVQEISSGVRTIVGVGTSTALFIGRTATGPLNRAIEVNSYSEFLARFGDDLGATSSVARYVRLFFLNGGTKCFVIRIADNAQSSGVTLQNETGTTSLVLTAKNPGAGGDLIRAIVTYNTASPEATFNLELFRWELVGGTKQKRDREELLNLSMDPLSPNYAEAIIKQRSKLVNAVDANVGGPPPAPGFSVAMRPLTHAAGDGNQLAAAINSILANQNELRISIEGKPFINVVLPNSIPGAAALATVRTSIGDAIETAIANAVNAALITGLQNPPVEVDVLDGPGAAGTTTMIRLRSRTNGRDVIVQSATNPARDFAAAMWLGASNGGVEVSSYAARRPAPTGISLLATGGLAGALNASTLVGFASTLRSDLTGITLDELDANGNLVPVNVPLAFPGGAGTRMFQHSSVAGGNGTLEALGIIRDAINARAAASPATFAWKAELQGYRLTIVKTAGDDNARVTPALAFTGAASGPTANRFFANVRHYSLGTSGLAAPASRQTLGAAGTDGGPPRDVDYRAAYDVAREQIDLFNLLVLPPDAAPHPSATLEKLWPEASAFCASERAFLIMDPPSSWTDAQSASAGVNALRVGLTKDHSAVYFPRLRIVEGDREHIVGPAGAIAGLYARIDASRGVWKAPAGSEADLRGVAGVELTMSDLQNGQINPVGVNAIRLFPEGVISWGARTMDGADSFASEYKYIPVRRLALFIEESLYRGLKWAVFEPNDEPLWSQIRLNVGAFMQDLFRKGAFAGSKPSEAYFVKCDKETTTPNDQNLGIVNIWVGFAPLKPAEFVVLYLQQIAQKAVS